MNNLMNIATDILPQYDEIMDRQRENWEMEKERRAGRIAQKQKEYFEDVGTFCEFIQNIEISNADILFYEIMHLSLTRNDLQDTGEHIKALFHFFCEEKAVKEVDDDSD